MRELIKRLTRGGAQGPHDDAAAPQETPGDESETPAQPGAGSEAALKPPPELPLFFMLSHLDDDGPVRLDGVKLGVCEAMGLGDRRAEAGGLRRGAQRPGLSGPASRAPAPAAPGPPERQPQGDPGRATCPRRRRPPPSPLQRLLTELEARDGILDRRFYAVVRVRTGGRATGPAGKGRAVRPPPERPPASDVFRIGRPGRLAVRRGRERGDRVEINRRDMRVGNRMVRSLHLAAGPGPSPPASCKGSWRRERRWTCLYTSARYRLSRRPAPLSGRR